MARIKRVARRFVYRWLRYFRRHPRLDRVVQALLGLVPPVRNRLLAMIISDERQRPPRLIPLGDYGKTIELMLLRHLRVRG